MERLGEPHVTSFNHFLTDGMRTVIESIEPYEFELSNGEKLKVAIEDINIDKPRVSQQIDVKERRIFPAEARQRAVTYSGNCTMNLGWWKNGAKQASIEFELGAVPLMIRVSFCLKIPKTLLNFNISFISVACLQSQQMFT